MIDNRAEHFQPVRKVTPSLGLLNDRKYIVYIELWMGVYFRLYDIWMNNNFSI